MFLILHNTNRLSCRLLNLCYVLNLAGSAIFKQCSIVTFLDHNLALTCPIFSNEISKFKLKLFHHKSTKNETIRVTAASQRPHKMELIADSQNSGKCYSPDSESFNTVNSRIRAPGRLRTCMQKLSNKTSICKICKNKISVCIHCARTKSYSQNCGLNACVYCN